MGCSESMSEYDARFKEIIQHCFGADHDEIEHYLIGYNMLLDRIDEWKKSKVQDDRDFARWIFNTMLKEIVRRL